MMHPYTGIKKKMHPYAGIRNIMPNAGFTNMMQSSTSVKEMMHPYNGIRKIMPIAGFANMMHPNADIRKITDQYAGLRKTKHPNSSGQVWEHALEQHVAGSIFHWYSRDLHMAIPRQIPGLSPS